VAATPGHSTTAPLALIAGTPHRARSNMMGSTSLLLLLVLLLPKAAPAVLMMAQGQFATPTTSNLAAGDNWTAFPGRTFSDTQCKDLSNIPRATNVSCKATCDRTTGCTAINAHDGEGPCALRACACGVAAVPAGALKGFTAYYRHDTNCPPPPPLPLLARVFGSHMVLQREPLQARIFGRAQPGAGLAVTVTPALPDGSGPITTEADAAGNWACLLPATAAGGGYNITVVAAGGGRETLTDVLFGDVAVCSGQSNMEEPLSVVNNHTAELAAASNFPWIRVAVVGRDSSTTPLRDISQPLMLPWRIASAVALGQNNSHSWDFFSATCWLTARELAQKLGPGVPIGLVGSYVGGTPIERWTPSTRGVASGQGFASRETPDLYNSMVAPLTGLSIKFILWYQVCAPSSEARWMLYLLWAGFRRHIPLLFCKYHGNIDVSRSRAL
jgi:hypothetical protein